MFYTSQYEQQMSNENEVAAISNENESTKKSTRTTTTIRPNKQLPEKAIRLMNEWYSSHEDNPYPNRNDLDYLATNGGIKESQVKAWFSNKRNRTQNTHPKRAKRYLIKTQTQQNSMLYSEPEKIYLADEIEQHIQTCQQSNPSFLSTSTPSHWSCLSPPPPLPSYDYYHPYYYSQ